MESPTPEKFCERIREAGYATAVNYTTALIARLQAMDDYAKNKKGKAVQIIQETANAEIDPARFGGSFS
jgi:flagellum-specific peptidoglycan hydrolase FlgJ